MKPTFVGIGAQKCASSWLYDILADHPEVCVSEKKELDYFTHYYDNGELWYEAQFPEKPTANAVGEISPSYFHEISAVNRVKRYLPNARILVSLRNPIERALSQHRHLVRIGVLNGPDYSFETGLDTNPSYIEQGLYATHLSRWLAEFGQDQIMIILMDDIRADAASVASQVYQFLGISDKHRSAALMEKSNPSYAVRNRRLEDAVKVVRRAAKNAGLGALWQGLGNTGLRKLYRGMNRTASEAVIPKPRPETLDRLKKEFLQEIELLEHILSRDLSAWKVK
jgi:hypothetical protein